MKKSITILKLHSEALSVVQRYKRSEVELIEILQKVDRCKVFYHYKFSSLFAYATDGLGLSSEVASIFINVARKASEVPALKAEIQKGTITVSKARRMTAVLNAQNQKHWLEMAKSSSKRALEKEVAAHLPKEAIRDQLNYVPNTLEVTDKAKIIKLQSSSSLKSQVRVQLQAGVSESVMLKLRRVQDLVSQKLKRSASLEEAIEAMADLYLYHQDPLQKAKRQKIRGKVQNAECDARSQMPVKPRSQSQFQECPPDELQKNTVPLQKLKHRRLCGFKTEQSQFSVRYKVISKNGNSLLLKKMRSEALTLKNFTTSQLQGSSTVFRRTYRKAISSSLRHGLQLKYGSQCAYVDEQGQRCQQRRYLEMHHIVPVSQGGQDNIENLTLYCSGHHKAHHHQEKTFQIAATREIWPRHNTPAQSTVPGHGNLSACSTKREWRQASDHETRVYIKNERMVPKIGRSTKINIV